MGITIEVAEKIAEKVETRIYDGIETERILTMIFSELERYKPATKHQVDLRKALSLMNPKPDFERFVQLLLYEQGYTVTPNQIIRGRCVEHEVDGIARINGVTYIVEAKHHLSFHTPTGLDAGRIARAIIEDVKEGFAVGLTKLEIDGAIIVCNTKLSEHAKSYGECRGILHIGWSYPSTNSLQIIIEEKKLYPVTCLRDVDSTTRERLASAGIVMLKQLLSKEPKEISMATRISEETLTLLSEKAKAVLF